MQSKSSRGVQQEDVWGAADALIGEGLRPTIERVRQKMGRGSPNTVSPMLEAWFATLGPRLALGGAKADEGGPPTAVRQAMAKLWDIALSSAQHQATEALALAQQGLDNDRSALALRESELGHQAAVLNERLVASEVALVGAKTQLTDLNARLEEAHALLDRRAKETEQLQSKVVHLDQQLADSRKQSDQEATRHAEERKRLESRSTANERRLMEELDRERQEVKRAKIAADHVERRLEALQAQLVADSKALSSKVLERENELLSVRQALVASDARATELRGLLDEQRKLAATALDQLNRLVTGDGRGNTTAKRRSTASAKG
nr:DNA-binding protein [uncultured Rhodoferax sp.]